MSPPKPVDQASLHMVLDALAYPLIVIDEGGIVVITNQAWRAVRHHHQLSGDCGGQPYHHVFSPNQGIREGDVERLHEGIAAVLVGSLARFQYCYRQEVLGKTWWLELTVTPFPVLLAEQRVVLASLRDITEQKLAEHDLLTRAHSDDLTGLANRRFFLLQGSQMISLAKRHTWPVTLVYLDLDNFKYINDHYGHDAGDDVLVRVASCLQQHVRASDLLARLGGDEFVMLLMNMSRKNVLQMVRRFGKSLPQTPVPVEGSFGVAHYPSDGSTLETILSKADQRMYRAKAQRKAQREATRQPRGRS